MHRQDISDEALLPEEAALLDHSLSEKRKAEFTRGRITARKALKDAGMSNTMPLLKGPHGETIWPAGMTGSISHSGEYAVAAVTEKKTISGLGIDLEYHNKHRPLKTFDRVLHEQEYSWVHASELPETEKFTRAVTIFSLKEAYYKAFFAAYQKKLTFKDVSFRPGSKGNFESTLHKEISDLPNQYTVHSHSDLQNGYVLSGVSIL